MFKRYYYLWSLLLIAATILLHPGCKKDTNTITPIPDITIEATNPSEKMIGDVVELDPKVSYGDQQAEFSYRWLRYVTPSILKVVSNDKHLKITMDSLGTFLLKLEVTNLATKITAASTVTMNVISKSERGWYVLKSTSEGNTDMDAFLTSKNGDFINKDIVKTATGKAMEGLPVGISFTGSYNWLNPSTKKFEGYNSCLMPVSAKDVLAYRIKDERVLANSEGLFYEVPSISNRNFQALISDPTQMAIVNNGKIQTMVINSNSFLPSRLGQYNLSPYFTMAAYSYSAPSSILGFDQESESFMAVRSKQTGINYFPDVFLPEKGGAVVTKISSNHMGGKLKFLENTNGTYDTLQTTNGRAYALLQKNNSSDLVLLGLNTKEILSTWGGDMSHSPVRYQETLSVGTYPELVSATLYTLNKNNPILYFANGNRIGAYSIDTKAYTNNLYSFGSGEEITYMKFIDQQYDDKTFKNLVVATYTGGNYKIYRFIVLGNTLTLTGTVMEGNGRVKSMIYASPSYNFFNNTYIYY